MSRIARRLRLPICVAGFLIALPLLSVAPELIEQSDCNRIPLWVTKHQAHLPLDYTDFLAYPKEYRTAIFSALPGPNRVSIMLSHLQWFEASERGLTVAQRDFLHNELKPFLASGMLFDESVPLTRRQQMSEPMERKMKVLFASSLGARAIAGFDEPISSPTTLIALRIRVGEAIRGLVTGLADQECDCSVGSGYNYSCNGAQTCANPGNTLCHIWGPGCGFAGIYACDGLCCYPNDWGCGSDFDCCSQWCARETYLCSNGGTPILINIRANSGDDQLTSPSDGVDFDLKAIGQSQRVAWTRADAPVGFLVWDRNGNGMIDDGRELFGNATAKADGTIAANGFDALASFDLNHDGRIDSSDPIFGSLRLWLDRNHNGRSESDELVTLADVGIDGIYTQHGEDRHTDRYGNEYRYVGTAVIDKARQDIQRRIFDVWLRILD